MVVIFVQGFRKGISRERIVCVLFRCVLSNEKSESDAAILSPVNA